jgi:hypothetical protein
METPAGIAILESEQGWNMELLEDLMEAALIAVIRLGMPVAALFVIGYLLRRATLRRQDPMAGWHGKRRTSSGGYAQEMPCRALERPCWQFKQCPVEISDQCPAHKHPELPCWRAVKTNLGRLKAACPGCELFLTMPDSKYERG